MDKQFLLNRLQEVEQSVQQAILAHHAGLGARQEILNLLQNLTVNVGEGIVSDEIKNTVTPPNTDSA